MSILDILWKYREGFLAGLSVTLKLCLIIWGFGLLIGTIIGIASFKWKYVVGIPVRFFSFSLSGIPVLVLLYWLHFPLQQILCIVIDPFITAAATLSIINIFTVSESIQKVMYEFPQQYLIAAKVCGLSAKQILFKIQFPIILRQILPTLLIIQVNMLQMSLFASLISVEEVFRVAQRINSQIYRPVEIYSALAIFFIAICLPLNGMAIYMKKSFTRNISER